MSGKPPGLDSVPLDTFVTALATSLDRDELLRALGSAIEALLREVDEVEELAAKVEPELLGLSVAWGH